jgi:hypothetical protein
MNSRGEEGGNVTVKIESFKCTTLAEPELSQREYTLSRSADGDLEYTNWASRIATQRLASNE